nr:immunoglobulin heavy chain junction region [Macaca mulatta]MOW82416.1 immunoglobulin heavy chain junction region [Macaca mulatta]
CVKGRVEAISAFYFDSW